MKYPGQDEGWIVQPRTDGILINFKQQSHQSDPFVRPVTSTGISKTRPTDDGYRKARSQDLDWLDKIVIPAQDIRYGGGDE